MEGACAIMTDPMKTIGAEGFPSRQCWYTVHHHTLPILFLHQLSMYFNANQALLRCWPLTGTAVSGDIPFHGPPLSPPTGALNIHVHVVCVYVCVYVYMCVCAYVCVCVCVYAFQITCQDHQRDFPQSILCLHKRYNRQSFLRMLSSFSQVSGSPNPFN